MSIGRRFIDLARAELNSLLDYASRREREGGGQDDADGDGANLEGYSERELREELERRRRAREEIDDLLSGRRTGTATPPPSTGATREHAAGAGAGARRPPPPAGPPSEAQRIAKAYAALELPAGSDFEAVRTAYRALMRKYHPDRHTSSPQKQRAANEVAQRLTEAYKLLEKTLRPR